jgi:hypothetical protein
MWFVWNDTRSDCRARSGVGGNPPTGRDRSLLKPSQSLCKSELLKNVPIVLFLNKCDELEQKLALGLRVEDFVQLSTKREAGNDAESVKSCEYMLILLPLVPASLPSVVFCRGSGFFLPNRQSDAPCQTIRFDQLRNGKCSLCECLTDTPGQVRALGVPLVVRLTCEGSSDHLEYRTHGPYRSEGNTDVHYSPSDFRRAFYSVFTKYGASNPNRKLYPHCTNITVRFWPSDFPLPPSARSLG